VSITKDDWWAHFHTANQHTATARTTILNNTIRNFSMEVLHCVDADSGRAWDQIVTQVVTSNPPSFITDPRISKWIECKAMALRQEAEQCTFICTEQKAQVLHDQQKAIIQSCLESDLVLLRDETDKALDKACQRTQQEMANLKAQLQVQRENLKADLQDEVTRAACKECTACPKSCPNPIKVRSRSSLIAPVTLVPIEMASNQPVSLLYSVDGDEMQHARELLEMAPMAEDTNSPTPTADVPLAIPAARQSNPIMAILTAI
jgi:ElaB/YqjD/DUF883 family membrane-anchored ribosome-binding protein